VFRTELSGMFKICSHTKLHMHGYDGSLVTVTKTKAEYTYPWPSCYTFFRTIIST